MLTSTFPFHDLNKCSPPQSLIVIHILYVLNQCFVLIKPILALEMIRMKKEGRYSSYCFGSHDVIILDEVINMPLV